MTKKDLVVKTNRLNQAIQNLSLVELRIIQLAIIDARETGNGLTTDTPLRIEAKRYASAFDTTVDNAYKVMKQAEDTLFNRRFSFIDTDGKLVKSRWIQQAKYLDDQAAIDLVFTISVVKGITRINGAEDFFTQYLLKQTSGLTSVYAVRLYELLIQWKKAVRTPLFEIKHFREQLGLSESKYTLMSDFKRRVLDLAIKEINDKTDLIVSYSQKKQGKVIVGFEFTVKIKPREECPRDPDTVDMFNGHTDNELKDIPSWQIKGLSPAQIKKISVFKKEFIDANTDKILSTDQRGYDEIFEEWSVKLADPKSVNNFRNIKPLLERERTK